MQLQMLSANGEPTQATVDVGDNTFGAEYNGPLVHQVVQAYLADARAGTKARKSRSEVRGGGAKPYRQKGMGRARAGSIRSPIWRGGGATFAAKPRSYTQKVNRKMFRGAMRCIVSELVRQDRLIVVEALQLDQPKTRDIVAKLGALAVDDVLIVVEARDPNLELATRNLHWAAVASSADVDPVSLVAFDKIVVTASALKRLEERLGNE